MVYLGRIVGVGFTKEGKPVCVYAVSGRSDSSKARIAHKYESRIFIGSSLTRKPYDKISNAEKNLIKGYLSGSIPYQNVSLLVKELNEIEKKTLEDQIKGEEFIFYNGIKVKKSIAVVSNGVHTEDILNTNDLHGVLKKFGPELDGPNRTPYTPRIGGLVDYCGMPLGIISRPSEVEILGSSYQSGSIEGISTYAGNPASPRDIVINHEPKLLELPAEGKTAQRLADDLFDWMDKEFIVCTAAAILTKPVNGKWELAVRNLHGD
ncbi:MAG: IMP cyclohydrolase [Candidatus Aenigmatarchaeota archaeon]